uniref:M-phase phosphoprotein 6 n=1 Tax=Arion vulgaris TaxID=1028688 RepID=A0A0B7A1F2_9EUPU
MASPRTTAHLSKNVLQMKFMQRSVLRIEREQNEEERQKVIDDEHWVRDLPEYRRKESPFLKDQSYTICEQLTLGRQSYRGFNPDIEKMMLAQINEQEMKRVEEQERQDSVGEKEMANRYSSLMGVIAKKFTKKRTRNKTEPEEDANEEEPTHKKSFMKPSDD